MLIKKTVISLILSLVFFLMATPAFAKDKIAIFQLKVSKNNIQTADVPIKAIMGKSASFKATVETPYVSEIEPKAVRSYQKWVIWPFWRKEITVIGQTTKTNQVKSGIEGTIIPSSTKDQNGKYMVILSFTSEDIDWIDLDSGNKEKIVKQPQIYRYKINDFIDIGIGESKTKTESFKLGQRSDVISYTFTLKGILEKP